MKRYWKCRVCGKLVVTRIISPLVCSCLGGFAELTEELYKLVKELEKKVKS